MSRIRLPNDNDQAVIGDTGFRPGSRDPFLSAKVEKTTDAPPGLIRLVGRKAGQLAESVLSLAEGLKQGLSDHQSVHPEGWAAGVGKWEE